MTSQQIHGQSNIGALLMWGTF